MRNLILASIVFASAATVFVYQRTVLGNTRQDTRQLLDEHRRLQESIRFESNRIAELQKINSRNDTDLRSVREKLEVHKAQQPVIPRSALNPRTEGQWPEARPYFYLAKKHIPSIAYGALGADGSLTREAIAVFGMTAGEQRAVNQAVSSLLSRIQERELKSAYLTNTPPFVAQRSGEKISVFVPAQTDLPALQKDLASNIQTILGPERAGLFLERAREVQHQFESFSGKDLIVTFIPKDQESGEIIISGEGSTMFHTYDFTRTQDFMLTQYRHLLIRFVDGALP